MPIAIVSTSTYAELQLVGAVIFNSARTNSGKYATLGTDVVGPGEAVVTGAAVVEVAGAASAEPWVAFLLSASRATFSE